MNETVIRIENLSKQYRLGTVSTGTISHDLNRWWHLVRGKDDPYLKIGEVNDRAVTGNSNYVWALKDINLEVKRGEVLGIIGKNGAGKSTLLKILSRVTGPTTGKVGIKGRIGSLLEVGTGFHPELTGKENIFLNGAILGMTKLEIKTKLDEIIDFSGTSRYIDTPVKRYSSGMKVRLAFAVAAHLDPEILVIDEVLAVGDAEFQKKAIGKMESVSKSEGRAILFVSHNMTAVRSLCSKTILLSNGMIDSMGPTVDILRNYLNTGHQRNYVSFRNRSGPECKNVRLVEAWVKSDHQNKEKAITMEDEVLIGVIFELKPDGKETNISPVVQFKDQQGNYLFVSGAKMNEKNLPGIYKAVMRIKPNFFNSGVFTLNINFVMKNRVILRIPDILDFSIVDKMVRMGNWYGKSRGVLKPEFPWKLERIDDSNV